MEIQKHQKQLPKIDDLYKDLEVTAQHNDLNKLLNCQPKQDWIKINKFANNSKYIPVGIIEYLLTSIFVKWRVEIKGVKVIANSVVCEVRLYVLDPVTGEWDWQDGVGASPIQTQKGAEATDFSKVNTAAVQMAAPAAETYAFKDAAEKFGRLFGKDLNREVQMDYLGMMENRFAQPPKDEGSDLPEELVMVIENADTKDVLSDLYKSNAEFHSNPKFMQLLTKRKNELNGTFANTGR